MAKVFKLIKIPIYEGEFCVSIGQTNEEFAKSMRRSGASIEIINDNFFKDNDLLLAYNYILGSGLPILIRFKETRPSERTIAHEIFHFTCRYLSFKGLKLSSSSEEAYAYFNDWLTGEIYKLL